MPRSANIPRNVTSTPFQTSGWVASSGADGFEIVTS